MTVEIRGPEGARFAIVTDSPLDLDEVEYATPAEIEVPSAEIRASFVSLTPGQELQMKLILRKGWWGWNWNSWSLKSDYGFFDIRDVGDADFSGTPSHFPSFSERLSENWSESSRFFVSLGPDQHCESTDFGSGEWAAEAGFIRSACRTEGTAEATE